MNHSPNDWGFCPCEKCAQRRQQKTASLKAFMAEMNALPMNQRMAKVASLRAKHRA